MRRRSKSNREIAKRYAVDRNVAFAPKKSPLLLDWSQIRPDGTRRPHRGGKRKRLSKTWGIE